MLNDARWQAHDFTSDLTYIILSLEDPRLIRGGVFPHNKALFPRVTKFKRCVRLNLERFDAAKVNAHSSLPREGQFATQVNFKTTQKKANLSIFSHRFDFKL